MTQFAIRLRFHGDLPFFLPSKAATVNRQLSEKTSIKDAIEACGVPHTEVDLILIDGQPVDFSRVIASSADIDVHPIDSNRVTLFPENRLQVRNIVVFVADGHLGKLVRDLRLLGIDIVYDRDAEDRQLLNISIAEGRALLTRDRRLLMHSVLRDGYYLRSQNPLEQTLEVLRRFDLATSLAPFSRCLRCNAPLEAVEKHTVVERLEPLTKLYYKQFRKCPGCGQIYWPGSHFETLQQRIETICSRLSGERLG